jgi:pseudouridine-5'-phosphate glycosidase
MIRLHPEVAEALAAGRPVVALESTVFSTLGLPAPANGQALERCLAAVRRHAATPALTAVLDGVAHVGVDPAEHGRILAGDRKVAERDLGVAVGLGWEVGCTTVSASLALAAAAGVSVFATGGIGGVHRGAAETGDVSADLDALARHRLVTVSAGAKAFLDLARTLEDLESRSVPVLGFGTGELPAFYSRSSGLALHHRVDSAAEVAAVAVARWALGGGGVLVANPIPEADELTGVGDAVTAALRDAVAAGIRGAPLTPFVLARIAAATEGRSVPANLALAEHNAAVAATIAVELSRARA